MMLKWQRSQGVFFYFIQRGILKLHGSTNTLKYPLRCEEEEKVTQDSILLKWAAALKKKDFVETDKKWASLLLVVGSKLWQKNYCRDLKLWFLLSTRTNWQRLCWGVRTDGQMQQIDKRSCLMRVMFRNTSQALWKVCMVLLTGSWRPSTFMISAVTQFIRASRLRESRLILCCNKSHFSECLSRILQQPSHFPLLMSSYFLSFLPSASLTSTSVLHLSRPLLFSWDAWVSFPPFSRLSVASGAVDVWDGETLRNTTLLWITTVFKHPESHLKSGNWWNITQPLMELL